MNILITGSSTGLGEGLSKFYCQNKHNVWGISRKQNNELNSHPTYHEILVDLTDYSKTHNSISKLLESHKNWDLIILNAGIIGEIGDMRDIDMELMKSVLEINLWANKHLLDIFSNSQILPKQVIAISSGAATKGSRGWNAYAISKAALNMMMELYAEELPKVHISAIAPGLIDTNMQRYIAELKQDKRFPIIQRLQSARGTTLMPTPSTIAPVLDHAFSYVKNHVPSGSFVDIRDLNL
jgi:benzil reductase ((S)-benzoin forming)